VRQGRTVFMVTHDKDIAKRASRAITLSDGEIVQAMENVHA
jgi:ABC-type lipoprotein export system ATPase subunit